jgi:thrombospondin type 3 repeat protein
MINTKCQKTKISLIIILICGFWLCPIYSNAELVDPDSTEVNDLLPDTDGDGINDNFEDLSGMNKNDPADVNGDLDSDGLTNLIEFGLGTDLNNADTDGDGVTDDVEVARGFSPLLAPEPQLGENCTIAALNRTGQVNPDGSFSLPNIPLPEDGDFFRLRAVCELEGRYFVGVSNFLTATGGNVTPLDGIDFNTVAPIPISLDLAASATTLTPTVLTGQITTTGNLAGSITVDLTASTAGTSYTSSNAGVATIDAGGLVTAVSSGTVFITAINEGAVATIPIQVVLGDDTDGDGIPNDFEIANSIDPGGDNVSLLTGAIASAHAEVSGSEAAKAIDGDASTVWMAQAGGSPTFFEVTLPADTNVAQVRLIGDPAHSGGAVEFFRGIFQVFDALDNELFNSGDITLPG